MPVVSQDSRLQLGCNGALLNLQNKDVYYAFGLTINSDWDIPCSTVYGPSFGAIQLRSADGEFFSAAIPSEIRNDSSKRVQLHHLADGSRYLHWSKAFEFHISPDSQVVHGRSLDGSPEAAFKTYMLGHLLSYVLLGMGRETIHAACIAVGGNAIGFLGDSARGKSTLSAAFLRAGWSLLSDDFLVLERRAEDYFSYPGLPRIKLYERIATQLKPVGVQGTPMNTDHCPKMIYPIENLPTEALPIRALYSLASPKSVVGLKGVRIQPLTEKEAYLELTENSFNVRVRTPERLISQFHWATQLVKKVPIKRLYYPRVLTILPEVIEAVKEDLDLHVNKEPSALVETLPARTPK